MEWFGYEDVVMECEFDELSEWMRGCVRVYVCVRT
jgi:hypothetical protein